MFFASIEAACERRDVVEIKIGNLSLTTDATPNPQYPDCVIMTYKIGARDSAKLNRERLLSACKEFYDIFGRT
jgi:hypothetical protein